MPAFRRMRVGEIISERTGLQRVRVDGDRAYVLTALTGTVAPGDDVIVNTTAVDLGLGTGGWHVVHWNLARDDWVVPGAGHIMKMRYTSLQADVGAAEEHLATIPERLDGLGVVGCTVHSQVGIVAAVARARAPSARIAYVMTDGAALPIALSDLVADLVDGGIVDHTVTTGHAFGGDDEAVTVLSGLAVARAAGADLAVVGMGPGVVGTGHRLATTAIEVAGILDQAGALGARTVLAVRASHADARERHRGVSHHARTVLDLAQRPVLAPVPSGRGLGGDGLVEIDAPDVAAILAAADLGITTMGRTIDDDPVFFESAAVAALAGLGLDDG